MMTPIGEAIVRAFVAVFMTAIFTFLISLVVCGIVIFLLTRKTESKKKWILRILLPPMLAILIAYLTIGIKFGMWLP